MWFTGACSLEMYLDVNRTKALFHNMFIKKVQIFRINFVNFFLNIRENSYKMDKNIFP